MSRFSADQNQVGFYYTSGTYATASGALQWFGLVQNHEINETLNTQPVRYTGGGDRNVQQWVQGGRDVEGTITYYPQDWKMLAYALGSIVDSGTPSPFVHTIKELNGDSTWPYTSGALNPFADFNIEDAHVTQGDNHKRTVAGAIVNEWSMNWSQGGIIECELSYVAQSVTSATTAPGALTAATTRPHLWRDVKVYIPSGTLVQSLSEGTITVSNNLNTDTHYTTGSDVRQPMIPENRDYTIELTKHEDNEWSRTLYDQYFKGGSDFNMLVEVTDASAGAGSREMFWTFSGCCLDPMSTPTPAEGTNETTLTIKAKTSSVLVNDTISTYAPW